MSDQKGHSWRSRMMGGNKYPLAKKIEPTSEDTLPHYNSPAEESVKYSDSAIKEYLEQKVLHSQATRNMSVSQKTTEQGNTTKLQLPVNTKTAELQANTKTELHDNSTTREMSSKYAEYARKYLEASSKKVYTDTTSQKGSSKSSVSMEQNSSRTSSSMEQTASSSSQSSSKTSIMEQHNASVSSKAEQPSSTVVKSTKYSEYALKALQESRSRITHAGKYQERYKNEFESGKQELTSEIISSMLNRRNVKENALTSVKITKEQDLQSYKLVQNLNESSTATAQTTQRKTQVSSEEMMKQFELLKERVLNAKVIRQESFNNSEKPPKIPPKLSTRTTTKVRTEVKEDTCYKQQQSISVNLKANLLSNPPRCKTPDTELKEKPIDKDKVSSIDALNRLEAQISSIEANTLKKDGITSNIYGELENLLQPGLSDLESHDPPTFDRGTRARNSTGGVQPSVSTAESKLGRTASDSQDRPIPRIRKNIHAPINKPIPLKTSVQVT